MENVTLVNLAGDSERVALPSPHYEVPPRTFAHDYGGGVCITALYSGPRTRRRFIRTESIWQKPSGVGTVGTVYSELSESDYLDACERAGCEPVHVGASVV